MKWHFVHNPILVSLWKRYWVWVKWRGERNKWKKKKRENRHENLVRWQFLYSLIDGFQCDWNNNMKHLIHWQRIDLVEKLKNQSKRKPWACYLLRPVQFDPNMIFQIILWLCSANLALGLAYPISVDRITTTISYNIHIARLYFRLHSIVCLYLQMVWNRNKNKIELKPRVQSKCISQTNWNKSIFYLPILFSSKKS